MCTHARADGCACVKWWHDRSLDLELASKNICTQLEHEHEEKDEMTKLSVLETPASKKQHRSRSSNSSSNEDDEENHVYSSSSEESSSKDSMPPIPEHKPCVTGTPVLRQARQSCANGSSKRSKGRQHHTWSDHQKQFARGP